MNYIDYGLSICKRDIFTNSTFMSYTPLLKYNPHTDCTNLYLNQRFRHKGLDTFSLISHP